MLQLQDFVHSLLPFLFLRSSNLPLGTNAPGGAGGAAGPPGVCFPAIIRESRTGGAAGGGGGGGGALGGALGGGGAGGAVRPAIRIVIY